MAEGRAALKDAARGLAQSFDMASRRVLALILAAKLWA